MYDFKYHRATDVAEASEMIRDDFDAKVMAGGMTLLPTLKQRLSQVSTLVDLSRIDGLAGIEKRDGMLWIGAMTRHNSVANSALVAETLPVLASLAHKIGDHQVRNRGTIGGSVANSDPAADYPAAVLGLNAEIITDRRTIDADDFFLDLFETALEGDEIITGFHFPIIEKATYLKVPNPASRYATVGLLLAVSPAGYRVAVTGAKGCVFRWSEAEDRLNEAFSVSSITPLALDTDGLNDDIHASADYRAHLASVLLEDAVTALSA